jgi:hypothetical protein
MEAGDIVNILKIYITCKQPIMTQINNVEIIYTNQPHGFFVHLFLW